MKIIGIILLVVGIILLILGFNATDAPTEELKETFTGKYSDTTVTYFIIGGIAAAVGLVLTLKRT
ncbi:MAG: DUF3185 family protein [Fulvivirga sp.]